MSDPPASFMKWFHLPYGLARIVQPRGRKGCADTLDATSQLSNKLPAGVLPSEGSTDA